MSGARTFQDRGLERPAGYPPALALADRALDDLLRRHDLRQSDVARRLEVDPANVSAWCVGKRPLPSYWLAPLARVLGISVAGLAGRLQHEPAPEAVPEPESPLRGTGTANQGPDLRPATAAPGGNGHAVPVGTATVDGVQTGRARARTVLYSAELPLVPYRPQPRPLVGCLRCRRTWYAGRQFATHPCPASGQQGAR
jgi:hypothetical protein